MIVNVSQLLTYRECPRKWQHRYLDRRGLAWDEAPLAVGKIVHSTMEAHLGGMPMPQALVEVFDAQRDTLLADPATPEVVKERASRQLEVLRPVVEVWEDRFADVETVATEQVLTAPFGYGNTLVGRLDRVVRWTGELSHYQHKTATASIDRVNYFKAAKRAPHELAYRYLLQHNYPNERVNGTIMNVFLKSTSVAAVLKDPKKYNIQQPVALTQHDVDEFLKGLESDVAGMSLNWQKQNTEQCFGRFGKSPCQYLPVCEGNARLDLPPYTDLADSYEGVVNKEIEGEREQ